MSKASNLRVLSEAGFRVPPFVVVPARAFDDFSLTLSDGANEEKIIQASLPAAIQNEILELVRQLPDVDLAVRSSLAEEDSARYSFAGQLDSFLNVRGREAVLDAVKKCWASAYGKRAQAYHIKNGLLDKKIEMEVILQTMAPADISGVVFTADPATRDPRWMVISVVKGLGDELVQGKVSGETFRVNHETGEWDGDGALLKKSQVSDLVAVSRRIEALFKSPQDIEFAFIEDGLFILQARPITTPIPTEHILWDNANITESYSGITSPLTFSIIRGSYANVYRQFLSLMGVKEMDETVLKNLLGFYNGQVYYQLFNWYEALSWLPAFDQNRRFLEQMMGVKQSAGEAHGKRTGGWFALFSWGMRMVGLHLTSERRAKDFLLAFNTVLAEYRAKDFSTMTPHQLHESYRDLEKQVLGEWRAPILNDFLAMIFFGILRSLTEKWFEPGSSLHNDLLAGDGDIESIQPARRVQAMARSVRNDRELGAIFDLEPVEILERIRSQENIAAFRMEFDEYLQTCGDRCMNELKLEEPNLRDDPLPLIRMIAAAAKNPSEMPEHSPVRARAEARLSALPLHKRFAFQWILNNARRYVRNRENLRFARSRLFGLLRGILNSLGRQWAQAGVLPQAADVYYLTIGEIWDFVHGTAVTQDLKSIVSMRRTEFAGYKTDSVSLPDRFETFGIPYLDSPRGLLVRPMADDADLQGVGCCSGIVTGKARVVYSVNEVSDLGGQVLVAERTDPGWVFLYPSASGILVERGSPLSHSAIVARELGKPIIVNIPNLTRRVRSGDRVEMNGGRGTVKILP
ncbi:MAG: phosphoenolpyruvate synthase [Anaerolineaceae bacterium]|nr:MAG: phosphoenolpyruvate synthase [Anaerolineaceae bacterium]